MSFGFSVSDIVGCARLAYRLYDEFRQAPRACQTFAQELLLFHQVLMDTELAHSPFTSYLSHPDQAALRLCLDSCKELLCVQIMGAHEAPDDLREVKTFVEEGLSTDTIFDFILGPTFSKTSLNRWRRKIRERKFALQIPKFQSAISSHIEKLKVFLALYVSTIHEVRFAADLPMFQI